MNIEKRLISNNFTSGRQGHVPQYVVIHTYNGKGTYLDGWFNNPVAQVSAHYSVLKSGVIAQYVNENDTAWHAGDWTANIDSIGVEHQDDGNPSDSVRTNELYENSCQLIADIYRRYNWDLKNQALVKPHKEFTNTGCPGGLSLDKIRNRVYEILNPPHTWKDDATDIGIKNYVIEKDINLYEIDTLKVVKTISKGSSITVNFALGKFRLTNFSFKQGIKNGFKIEDLEYKEPVVIPPVIIPPVETPPVEVKKNFIDRFLEWLKNIFSIFGKKK